MAKKTVTIDRSKWRCGEGGRSSHGKGLTRLLNKQGYMCCLGMKAKQQGVPPQYLRAKQGPEEVDDTYFHLIPKLVDSDHKIGTSFTRAAIQINDNMALNDTDRESLLKALAKKYGETWKFVGDFAEKPST